MASRTITVDVCGTPTVNEILRWTAICCPETIIFHVPDVICENGIPLNTMSIKIPEA